MSLSSILKKYCFLWNRRPLVLTADSSACHLTLGLYPDELFSLSSGPFQQQTQLYICSIRHEIIRTLAVALRCRLDFAVSSRSGANYQLQNGSWNGILALLETKKADFIAHQFFASPARATLIHYAFLYPEGALLSILSAPKQRTKDQVRLWEMFTVFSGTIWCLIGLGFALFLIITALGGRQRVGSLWERLSDSLLEVSRILLGQGDALSFFGRHGINCLIFWSLGAFLLRQFFSSHITASLLVQNVVKIDTFTQLAQLKSRILLKENSSVFTAFSRLYPNLLPQVEPLPHVILNSQATLRRLASGNTVLVNHQKGCRRLGESTLAPFHVSREGHFVALRNFAIRKSLEVGRRKALSDFVMRLYSAGLVEQFERRAPSRFLLRSLKILEKKETMVGRRVQVGQGKERFQEPTTTATQQRLNGTFLLVYGLGVALAFCVLIGEWATCFVCY